MTPMSRLRLGLSIGFVVLALDHITKAWALNRLFFPPDRIEVLSILNFVPVWNRGVSFGLLASDSPYTPWLLGGFALAVSVAMVFWMTRATTHWLVIGLGLIVGGAVGNAIDRALHGAVVDFIDVHWADLHWPAFNIADAAISIGVGFILLDAFVTRTGQNGGSRDGS